MHQDGLRKFKKGMIYSTFLSLALIKPYCYCEFDNCPSFSSLYFFGPNWLLKCCMSEGDFEMSLTANS
jgi:hypothetical protein